MLIKNNNKEKTEKIKKSRGITLIALVVTIVILLILAAITINLVLADGGIFNKAEDAKEEQRIAEILEMLNTAEMTVSLDKNNLGKPTLETYEEQILKEKIVNNISEITIDVEKNRKYEVNTSDGYVFQITEIIGKNTNDIIIEYIGKATQRVESEYAKLLERLNLLQEEVNLLQQASQTSQKTLNLEYEEKTVNTTYIAETDGYVFFQATGNPSNTVQLAVYDSLGNHLYQNMRFGHPSSSGIEDTRYFLYVPKGCSWMASATGSSIIVRWFKFE